MEKKKLQDYIHFYIGQPCVNSWFENTHSMYDAGWKLAGVDKMSAKSYKLESSDDFTWSQEIKLILLPLTTLSEDELELFVERDQYDVDAMSSYETVEALAHTLNNLRKAGYDCDGLIAAGLAIDKTKGKEGKV